MTRFRVDPDDWRRQGQERFLAGRAWRFRAYESPRPSWDHDHCEFCGGKFSLAKEDLHSGYVTTDDQHWVCSPCFEDFREEMRWGVTHQFFQLHNNVDADVWQLGMVRDPMGNAVDEVLFTSGEQVQGSPRLRVSVQAASEKSTFSFAAFGIPVVEAELAHKLCSEFPTALQALPVEQELEARGRGEHLSVLVVTRLVDCVDEALSEIQYWPEEYPGEQESPYRAVTSLVLRAAAVQHEPIFRVARWPVALVVREDVKQRLEALGATGIDFEPVSVR